SSVSARCLEFLILTAVRSGEVRGTRWNEIDSVHAVWTIPAERMKPGREHRVPLSEPAMAALREMAQLGTEGFVFPGLKAASALSDKALAKAVDVRRCTGSARRFATGVPRRRITRASWPRRRWRIRCATRPRRRISAAICWKSGDG